MSPSHLSYIACENFKERSRPCGIVTNAEWETHNQILEPESDPCEERIHICEKRYDANFVGALK